MIKKILAAIIILLTLGLPVSFAETVTIQYDRNGNILSDQNHRYEYDELNQLKKVFDAQGNLLEEYAYDHLGNRIKKTEYLPEGLQTTYYPDKSLVRVVNSQGTFDTYYYYDNLGNLLVRIDPDGKKFYYHPDPLGSTTLITDEQGKVVEETSYLPFGEVREGGQDRFLYTGKEKDATGLMYYGARYYDPSMGRFTQPDTVIPDLYNPQSLNRYSYVLNNPYKYVDPEGENPLLLFSAIGGVLGAAYDMASQIWHGASMFDSSMNWGSVGTSALIGTGAGLAGGAGVAAVGGGVFGGTIGGVTGFVTGQAMSNVVSGSPVYDSVGMAGVMGAAAGTALGVGGKLVSFSTNIQWVDPKNLKPIHPPRSYVNILDIKNSISKNGYDINKPIEVATSSDGRLMITQGHHRTRAAIAAGLDKVPVVKADPANYPIHLYSPYGRVTINEMEEEAKRYAAFLGRKW